MTNDYVAIIFELCDDKGQENINYSLSKEYLKNYLSYSRYSLNQYVHVPDSINRWATISVEKGHICIIK